MHFRVLFVRILSCTVVAVDMQVITIALWVLHYDNSDIIRIQRDFYQIKTTSEE